MEKYFLLPLLLALLSCGHPVAFKEFKNIRNEEWCMGDIPSFDVKVEDDGIYNFDLLVRHTTDYEWANLWCFVEISRRDSILLSDTVNIKLAEPSGKWTGSGISLKVAEQPINKNNIRLERGTYAIRIRQGMRIKCLNGVKDIGVALRSQQ